MKHHKKLCTELNIENKGKFWGSLPTQDKIYKYALQAKICILPN